MIIPHTQTEDKYWVRYIPDMVSKDEFCSKDGDRLQKLLRLL